MGKGIRTLLFVLVLVLTARAADAPGTISTVAGQTWVFRGNGGPAVNATLGMTSGAAVDSAGNVYAFDLNNNFVVKITPAGVLTIVAGNGRPGFSGDGGPAASAALGDPQSIGSSVQGVAVDAAGNLFITDTANGRIRKIAANGIISTVAGNGARSFSGDGGPATSAALNYPTGVAVDRAGNLFIVDSENDRIRKVTPDGIISTVAGATAGGASATSPNLYPSGVAVDATGNLFVALFYDHRVRKVTPDGVISTVAGNGSGGFSGDGGPATAAGLGYVSGVAIDSVGTLFIADDNRIRQVTRDGMISTAAGNGTNGFSGDGGPATSAALYGLRGVAVDATGNIFIADGANKRIRKVTPGGTISTVAGNGLFYFGGDGGPATAAWLHTSIGVWPYSYSGGVALDSPGNIFIADTANRRIRKVASNGVISTVAGNGVLGFSGDGGPATAAGLSNPTGVAADAAGNLFIADGTRVRKIAPDGIISTVAGNENSNFSGDGGPATSAGLYGPRGLTVDGAGDLFIADSDRVRKVTPDGIISTVAGVGSGWRSLGDGGPATRAGVSAYGVAVDTAGNLFIADGGSNRIRKVTTDGIISTVAGSYSGYFGDGGPATSAEMNYPTGVAVDAAGNLFIADRGNNRIRKVAPNGIISTVAGNGSPGFSGDGGPATSAGLSPAGVAVDAAGNLFIADILNDRIRKVLAPTDSGIICCPTFRQPLLSSIGPVNGATYFSKVAAGSIVSLFGQYLASSPAWPAQLPLPTSLNDVTARMNGIAAPLFYVSPNQLNLQVPWELLGQNPITLTVTANGVTSPEQYFILKPVAPGIFSMRANGGGQGAVQIANSAIFAARTGSIPGAQSRPADRGEYITMYCTGLGDVSNRPPSGIAASNSPLSVALLTPTVTIGGLTAPVSFAGLVPGFVGLYQINVQVPADTPAGDAVPVTVMQGGIQSDTVVTVAIQ